MNNRDQEFHMCFSGEIKKMRDKSLTEDEQCEAAENIIRMMDDKDNSGKITNK